MEKKEVMNKKEIDKKNCYIYVCVCVCVCVCMYVPTIQRKIYFSSWV